MPVENDRVLVWDPLVRIFHWSLAAGFAVAYITEDDWLSLHVNAGYVVLGLLVFRLAWGFVGTRHARFSDFVRGPSTVLAYLKAVAASRADRYVGHNPAGGAMVLALLGCLLATTFSGLAVYGHQEFLGPLAELISSLPDSAGGVLKELHETFANLTLVLVAVHIAGVVLASIQHRENLIHSMLTGSKHKEIN